MSGCKATAGSLTPRSVEPAAGAAQARVGVACSGGVDSLALLRATAGQAAGLGLKVIALHVHHGLQPEADAWAAAVQRRCRRWRQEGLPIDVAVTRLTGRPAAGESVEAWARRERYRALAALADRHQLALVLLAQHQRDQAETFLLQALRGGGAAGLAAMPRTFVRHGIAFARPWLDQPRERIESVLRAYRLRPVLDPSNADPRLARGRLRAGLWDQLRQAYPDIEAALGGAAARAASEAAVLDEVARGDATRLHQDECLVRAAWLALSPARRELALRHWLGQHGPRGAPVALTRRLLAEVPALSAGRWPAGDGAEVRLFRGMLSFKLGAVAQQPSAPAATRCNGRGPPVSGLDLTLPGRYPQPAWRGSLVVRRVARGGIPAEALASVELRHRVGGERWQGSPAGIPRSLKKQFQALACPAWARHGPLLWSADGNLIFVPGLGLDARVVSSGPSLSIEWQVDDMG